MGFRFRKSVNIGGARINFSKSGIGASMGGKGFRVTKKAGGGTRTTASIPGTGISYSTDSKSKSKKASTATAADTKTGIKILYWCLRVCAIPMFVLGLLLLLVDAVLGLLSIGVSIVEWITASHIKKVNFDNT